MADATPDTFSTWVQVGGVIGAIIGGAFLVVRGRWGEASTAITQTRQEATEIFVKETQANREALVKLQEILAKNQEGLVRLIAVQEDIASMMHKQQEDEKFAALSGRLLQQLEERERQQMKREIESRRSLHD